jgi:uncharacterized protein (DUF305 family)
MIALHQAAVEVAAERFGKRGEAQAESLTRQLHASEQQELERVRAWSNAWFGDGG